MDASFIEIKEFKISIIIPVYNAEQYIDKCIDSIINQTLKEIEIILIDDGSEDNSLNILRKFQNQDKRIKLLQCKNQGVAQARNEGIKVAKGSFIMFVDADDWIELNTCEKVYAEMIERDCDLIMWPYVREYKNKSLPKKIFNSNRYFYGDNLKEFHRKTIGRIQKELTNPEDFDALCTVWGKLYRKDIIQDNGLYFTDLKKIGTWEDGLFNMKYIGLIKSAYYINDPLYHYLKINNESITRSYKSGLFLQFFELYDLIEEYIYEHNLDDTFKEALNNRIALSIIGIGLNEFLSGNNKSHLERIIFLYNFTKYPKYYNAIKQLDIRYFPLQWKIFFLSIKLHMLVFTYILLQVIRKIISR